MRERLLLWFDRLRTGFWFVPIVMLSLAGVFAEAMLYLDRRVDPGLKNALAWAYTGGPDGARSLLSTIAGSMITAASVTFSLASVALSIASQQYGSRVLRNFMRDRITQVLLGTFVSTFIYCVLIVRDIRGSSYGGGFVPAIATTTAIALTVVSLILLIYFIHHISTSIQASQILLMVARDMEDAIPKLYPSQTGAPSSGLRVPRKEAEQGITIKKSGYLQAVDLETLLTIGQEKNALIELTRKPGDLLVAGDGILRVWGLREISNDLHAKILGAFHVNGERTPAQDIRFQFQQLTDVIVRALSPGINDPFTAINAIDQLSIGFAALLTRGARIHEEREDAHGVLRLVVPRPDLRELLDESVGHIAIYAASDRFVMRALRNLLSAIEARARDDEDRRIAEDMRRELDRCEREKE